MTNAEKQRAYRERKGIFPHIFKHETSTQRQKAYRERHRGDGTLWKPDPLMVAEYRKSIKSKLLTHYGDGLCVCVICGEDRIECLTLDHKNGGGNKHRKEIKKNGYTLYLYLMKNEYPDGYQTLCMNCQWIKRYERKEYNHFARESNEKVAPPL